MRDGAAGGHLLAGRQRDVTNRFAHFVDPLKNGRERAIRCAGEHGPFVGDLEPLGRCAERIAPGGGLEAADDFCDLGARRCRAIGECSNLFGHDGEAAPMLPGARGFDARVQRQQVRPVRDQVNRLDDVADLPHAARFPISFITPADSDIAPRILARPAMEWATVCPPSRATVLTRSLVWRAPSAVPTIDFVDASSWADADALAVASSLIFSTLLPID